jgi:hypothetical protein
MITKFLLDQYAANHNIANSGCVKSFRCDFLYFFQKRKKEYKDHLDVFFWYFLCFELRFFFIFAVTVV